jgi:predicted kinase
MTNELILTRGLPASGKSTWAQAYLSAEPEKLVRVERDMLRDQLLGHREYARITGEQENMITQVQMAMADAAFKAGKSVIISDTNLRAQYMRSWAKFAYARGADVRVRIFDDLSLDELIVRDMNREQSVGSDVIRMMWKKFTNNGKIANVDLTKEMSESFQVEPYDNPKGLPLAVVVDIDGTLAKMSGRSPYEWNRVGEDTPVAAVIDAVHAASQFNRRVVVMSGRDESCRAITEEWLTKHLGVSWHELHMRPEGDNRKDNIIKYELFNQHIRGKYHVKYVLDDRDQVVKMWRDLGLNCFQVAPGAF